MSFDVTHWGLVPKLQALALCGSLSRQRATAVRIVTCPCCQNIVDRHLHETAPFNGKPPTLPHQPKGP